MAYKYDATCPDVLDFTRCFKLILWCSSQFKVLGSKAALEVSKIENLFIAHVCPTYQGGSFELFSSRILPLGLVSYEGPGMKSGFMRFGFQSLVLEPMSCKIAVRIQLAKQNKDPTVRKKVMWLGAIAFHNFTMRIVIF